MIATCFENSREINLWHNLVYMRPWGLEDAHVVFQTEVKQNLRRNIYNDKK
jgi:hypothetical protein